MPTSAPKNVCSEHSCQLSGSLRANRLKATPARVRILDLLRHAARPLSISDLSRLSKKDGINQSTVYRNIKSLSAKGLVKKISLTGPQAYYELNDQLAERRHHHYLICRSCHKLVIIERCRVKEPSTLELKRVGFVQIDNHALELWGLCRLCSRRSQER